MHGFRSARGTIPPMAKASSKPFSFDPGHRIILLKGKETYLQSQYLRMIEAGLEAGHAQGHALREPVEQVVRNGLDEVCVPG